MKIRIGIPLANNCELKQETKDSLLLLNEDTDNEYELVISKGATIASNRNSCITKSKLMYQDSFDFDYFLSLDADISFQPEDLYKLIDSDKDIIAGIYQYKNDGSLAVAGMFDFGRITSKVQWDSKGIHNVDWFGAGFILIKSEAFQKLQYPYFRNELVIYNEGKDTYQDISGDDIGFCLNTQKSDIPLFANCDCKVKHI